MPDAERQLNEVEDSFGIMGPRIGPPRRREVGGAQRTRLPYKDKAIQ